MCDLVGGASEPESSGLRSENQENVSTVGDLQPRGLWSVLESRREVVLWGPDSLTCSLRSRLGFSLCLTPK